MKRKLCGNLPRSLTWHNNRKNYKTKQKTNSTVRNDTETRATGNNIEPVAMIGGQGVDCKLR